jgi:DNA-directed RNA polymerase sigma subunit (sigma70/sigma32)
MAKHDLVNELRPCMTLKEVAEALGMSPERVRQVQKRALQKLAQHCVEHNIDPNEYLTDRSAPVEYLD